MSNEKTNAFFAIPRLYIWLRSCRNKTEQTIKNGIRHVFQNHKKVIEGAAGVAVSALINNPERFRGKSVVIILCGANIDSSKFSQIISET